MTIMNSDGGRLDQRVILDMVRPGSSVLDLGCGVGGLLSLLVREKQVRGQGIERDEQAIYQCVARGLSVYHGDIDSGLAEYGDKSFDYVVFDQSLQQVRHPDRALGEALRVGRAVIVAFPNFAHWHARIQICFRGTTPVTPALPYPWHDSPNLHFLSISDFARYCGVRGITTVHSAFIAETGSRRILPNLFAQVGVFMITRGTPEQDTN